MQPLRVLVAATLLIAPLAACSAADSSTRTGAATVPQLRNQPLTAAESTLAKVGLTDSTRDASPLGRSVWEDGNWTVVGSSPAAGQKFTSGQTITLYVLKNEEATWFRNHPTMPKVTSSQDLSAISELVKYGYAPGTAPADAPDLESSFEGAPPSADEAAQARGLKESNENETFVGTRPGTGSKVRVGRYIYVLTRPEAVTPQPSPPADPSDDATSDGDGINLPNPDLPNHLPHVHHHHHW